MTNLQACDIVVMSHLRWDFVFQRPQHLLTRFATRSRVFFVEEPLHDGSVPSLEVLPRENGVKRVVPHLPSELGEAQVHDALRELMSQLMSEHAIENYVLWYYTPMAIPFTEHLHEGNGLQSVVYDCMDELSLFKGAHPELLTHEKRLFELADLVFTGGQSLYEHKRERHPNIHPFPSSIDHAHFFRARSRSGSDPSDQRDIPHPRIGFFGVVDERLDLGLIEGLAKARPEWQIVILGPVAKICASTLPKLPNIHYLGQKSYAELPSYISGWDVAMLPFARNESTRFISPTKTPEYLAAGKPAVSTSIRDVVRPYGEMGLVHIADSVDEFVPAVEKALEVSRHDPDWRASVDRFLSQISWDKTWQGMTELMQASIERRARVQVRVA